MIELPLDCFCICQYVYEEALLLQLKNIEASLHVEFNCFINKQTNNFFVIHTDFFNVYS